MNEVATLRKEIEELKMTVSRLESFNSSLMSANSIPLSIDQAFKTRFSFSLKNSSKTTASETQAVDEGGAGTYSVAKSPDGFVEYVSGTSVFYIPYYL